MEFFLDQVQMILPVLGFDFTQPRPGAGAREGAASESPVFELRKVGAVATAQEIDGQFVVFAGSTARKMGVPSWQSYKSLREKLVADGSLVGSDDPACLVFAGRCARPRPPSSDSSSSTTPRSSSSCSPRRMACVILRRSSQIAGRCGQSASYDCSLP